MTPSSIGFSLILFGHTCHSHELASAAHVSQLRTQPSANRKETRQLRGVVFILSIMCPLSVYNTRGQIPGKRSDFCSRLSTLIQRSATHGWNPPAVHH